MPVWAGPSAHTALSKPCLGSLEPDVGVSGSVTLRRKEKEERCPHTLEPGLGPIRQEIRGNGKGGSNGLQLGPFSWSEGLIIPREGCGQRRTGAQSFKRSSAVVSLLWWCSQRKTPKTNKQNRDAQFLPRRYPADVLPPRATAHGREPTACSCGHFRFLNVLIPQSQEHQLSQDRDIQPLVSFLREEGHIFSKLAAGKDDWLQALTFIK